MSRLNLQGPVHIDFNVTNACNLACKHCHSSSGVKLGNELSLKEVIKITTELHELGALSIAFAGGEPFVRPDIIEILAQACSLPGWSVSVITNGTFFNRRVIENLVRHCADVTVNISLDGSSARSLSILRKQRPSGASNDEHLLQKILNGIRIVVEAGLRNSVNFTLTRANIWDCLPTYRLAVDELKAGGMVAIKFFPGGFGKSHLDAFEIPYPLWHTVFTELTTRKLNGELPLMQISVPAPWEFYLPLIASDMDLENAENAWGYRSSLRERAYREGRSVSDVAGVAELAIAGDGLIYPSVLFVGAPGMVCGDWRQLPLKEIWESSPMLRWMRSLDIKDIAGGCYKCPLGILCGGGSRSRAHAAFNQVTEKDYLCPILPKQEAGNGRRPSYQNPTLIDSRVQRKTCSGIQRMTVWGKGSSAVRFFRHATGCDIRVSGYIIQCNEGLATLLDPFCTSPGGAASLGLSLNGTDAQVMSNLVKKLNELVSCHIS